MRLAIDGMMLVLCRRTPHRNIRCVISQTVVVYAVMKQLLLLTFMAVASEAMAHDLQCAPERAAMIDTIREYARSEAAISGPQGISERVLEAMGQTERHRFIPERSCPVAYMDAPVLIGHDQTISQPFIVALMTHLAELKSDDTVLEVGTGSGYQAAVLARLVRKVCTVEIARALRTPDCGARLIEMARGRDADCGLARKARAYTIR